MNRDTELGIAHDGTASRESAAAVAARLRRTEILLDVYHRIAGLETLDEVLQVIVAIASRETGAELGTLFLYDEQTGELYSRVAQGTFNRELRLASNRGVAGHVYTSGTGVVIPDAYQCDYFDPTIDQQTGFTTRNILCSPVKTVRGDIVGVVQTLNKSHGEFTEADLELLESMATQASDALMSTQVIERMKKTRAQELRFLEIVSDVTSEIELQVLLQKVMDEATKMLNAERSTLFLNDEKTGELWALVGAGLSSARLRFPNNRGIAGAVFTSGKSIDIPYAYADLRFNPAVDKSTGFFTRSILCVPVVNKKGKIIGVTQVLNKRGGPFTREDESRLRAFTAQVAIALENAKLFDEVQNMKNYNESMLESMSNGVITLDENGAIITCNAAGLRILQVHSSEIIHRPVAEFFVGPNAWIVDRLHNIDKVQATDHLVDVDIERSGHKVSVNLTLLPLLSVEKKKLGTMLMIEDISENKRVKSTLSRYMDPSIADQLLNEGGDDFLGGKSALATILFSDIRGFTTLTEELGAQGTVSLLNEYFTIMVDIIQREGGILDKFIGDAIMAAFGMPITRGDDEDRAMKASISMIQSLSQWNVERAARGMKPVKIGIGLNSDTVVAGNIGSPKRMDFTLIGDGVNLASRLESACKQYGAQILISEYTYRRLRSTYRIREVDKVIVKGKTEPVGIYEVLDFHTDRSFPNLVDVVNHFKDGLSLYRERHWDKAIRSFQEALDQNPGDRPSNLYIERAGYMKDNPPAEDWDGTWVMESK